MSGIDGDEESVADERSPQAKAAGLKNVVFAHTYNVASDLQDVISRDDVIMLDAGHTHTNNVANDGHTIYAATRSTGQISEGPVGFSLVNLDNGVVSWKFKPLGSWPFVMITSPADKGLMLGTNQFVRGAETVRAKVWDDKGVASVAMQIDGGTARSMQRIGTTQMWQAQYDFSNTPAGDHKIELSVQGAGGKRTDDTIVVAVASGGTTPSIASRTFGRATNSLGVYTEKGLLGNVGGGARPGGGGGNGPGRGAGPNGRAAGGPGPRSGPNGPCAPPPPAAATRQHRHRERRGRTTAAGTGMRPAWAMRRRSKRRGSCGRCRACGPSGRCRAFRTRSWFRFAVDDRSSSAVSDRVSGQTN